MTVATTMTRRAGEVFQDYRPLVILFGLVLMTVTLLWALAALGYQGLSYSIAIYAPGVFFIGAAFYCYVTMELLPLFVVVLLTLLTHSVDKFYDFPEQGTVDAVVNDVDAVSQFLSFGHQYRVETSAGVFHIADDLFTRGQTLKVATSASADGFAQTVRLCSPSACARVLIE